MTAFTCIALLTRILGCVVLVGSLAGCTARQLFNEGLSDIKAGRWDVGLAKIEDAARKDPDSAFLRTELRLKRAHVIHILLQDADTARIASRFSEARELYSHVLDLDRDNEKARKGLELAKTKELNQEEIRMAKDLIGHHELKDARAQLAHILSTDPSNLEAKELLDKLSAPSAQPAPPAQTALAKPKLRLKDDRIASLDFRDTPLNMVFQALSRTSGLNFVLDKDVKGDAKTSIFVKDLSVESALDLVLAQHTLEKKIMSDNTVFIYPETLEKRRRFEEQVVKSFYLTNTDPKQAMNLLKVMLDTKVLFVDDHAKLLVMRDTPEVVRMAEKLIASIDQEDSEVMMEVEVVEIQRAKLQELGIKYPNQVTLTALAPSAVSGAVGAPVAATQMLLKDVFNLDTERVRVSPLSATIDLRREDTQAHLLASPRIRARNYEKAKILIGDRVPVITNAVTPTSVGASVVTGNVQYIDVGLKFEVEPTIFRDDEVSMKVNLEVSNIVKEVQNTVSGTLAYQIGTRTAATVLRLRDGETQVLGGLISEEERELSSKVPGLGDIPILGRLFSSRKGDNKETEIVLSITPHIIRHGERPSESMSQFLYGTESARGVSMMFKAGEDNRNSIMPSKGAPVAAGLLPVAPAPALTAPLPAAAAVGAEAVGGQPESLLPGEPPPVASPEKAGIVPLIGAPVAAGLLPVAPAPALAAPLPAAAAVGAEAAGGQPESLLPGEPPPVASPEKAGIVPLIGAPEAAGLQPVAPAPALATPLPTAAAVGAEAAGGQPESPSPGALPPVAGPGNVGTVPSKGASVAPGLPPVAPAPALTTPLPAAAAVGAEAAGGQPESPSPGALPPVAGPGNVGTVPSKGASVAPGLPPVAQGSASKRRRETRRQSRLPSVKPVPAAAAVEAEAAGEQSESPSPGEPLAVESPENTETVPSEGAPEAAASAVGAEAAEGQPESPSPDEPLPVASPKNAGVVPSKRAPEAAAAADGAEAAGGQPESLLPGEPLPVASPEKEETVP